MRNSVLVAHENHFYGICYCRTTSEVVGYFYPEGYVFGKQEEKYRVKIDYNVYQYAIKLIKRSGGGNSIMDQKAFDKFQPVKAA